MWIAKDKDGEIYLYSAKPCKRGDMWQSSKGGVLLKEEDLPEELRKISWNDESPIHVTITLKKVCG